jgi:hypothetical protein
VSKFFLVTAATLLACLLLLSPTGDADANYNYGHSYGYSYGYKPYFNYYPTLPAYGYNYGYQSYTPSYSYYVPSYSYTQTYVTPSYSTSNLYDGNYHYHAAGTYQGVYYPAGNYAWQNNTWVGQGAALATPVAPADWKTTLLKVASKRDEFIAYQNALRELGLPQPQQPPGNFQPPPGVQGATPGGYGVNKNANLGTYGANASTLYGYTYSSVKDLYGDANLNTLFAQAERLATNAQALGGQATQQFQQTVQQEGGNRARVAEALARGQAAATALRAAQGSETHQSQTTTRYGTGIDQQAPPEPQSQRQGATAPSGQMDPAWIKLATEKCLDCHGEKKMESKFDVRKYGTMSLAERAKRVWPRINPEAADDKRMPKDHPPLTPEEYRLFISQPVAPNGKDAS